MAEINPLFGGSAWMGVCYQPYHQAGVPFGNYTKADVEADMATIAEAFTFIRTYTVQNANRYNVEVARAHGIKVALGAWIYPGDAGKTNQEIDLVLQQANESPDTVKCIVVGNEVDLESANYTTAEVERAITYAKSQKNQPGTYPNLADTPITICFTGTGPTKAGWSDLVNACESYVFLTIYPWFAPDTPEPNNISGNMDWSYNNGMKQVEASGRTVIIAEIGWPSAGFPEKKTTPDNEFTNYRTTCAWINGDNPPINKNYVTFWFEMFDEPWKTDEGPQGPHWGLYSAGESPQPKKPIPPCG